MESRVRRYADPFCAVLLGAVPRPYGAMKPLWSPGGRRPAWTWVPVLQVAVRAHPEGGSAGENGKAVFSVEAATRAKTGSGEGGFEINGKAFHSNARPVGNS